MKKVITIASVIILILIFFGCNDVIANEVESLKKGISLYQSKDYIESYKIFTQLSEQGNPAAQGYLGLMYREGLGVEQSLSKAAMWFERSAEGGNYVSMGALASLYEVGNGVNRDHEKSLYWYHKAADLGDSSACFALYQSYKYGIHGERSESKSNKYIKLCSNYNDEQGVLCKALIYYHGIDHGVDYAKAKILFEDLRNKGNATGVFYLYRLYQKGLGVDVNTDKALSFLNEAAEFEHPLALYGLALQHYKGTYYKKDYKKAFYYAKKSARAVSEAAYMLGVMYEIGLGTEVDIDKAKYWYDQAIGRGNQKAKSRLDSLQ